MVGNPATAAGQRVALVVNSRSRTGQQAYEEASKRLASLGVEVNASYPLQDPERLPETVREVVDQGCDTLVLGGGDGTVSSVVDFLADRPTVLGLLPLGTANDFARTLQVPGDLEQACETIARGKVVDVDLGLVGDNFYVNVASVGLSVGVTQALSAEMKRRMGGLAYPVASLRAFLRHRPFSASLTFPDEDHEPLHLDRLVQVAVGNGRFYGGGNVVAPDAGIDDHTLDVYAIQMGRRRDLIGVARYFKSGDFIRQENVRHLTTQRVVLETDQPQPVNVDGEIVAHTPQEFRIRRNALRVLVPEDSSAAQLDHEDSAADAGRVTRQG